MTRVWLLSALLLSLPLVTLGRQAKSPEPVGRPQNQTQKNSSQSGTAEEEPPEEDEGLAPEKYVLNPLESDRNVRVGNFYWHKGKYRAAAERYQRATRFNPSSAEAFFKLGEAEEKLNNAGAARVAFQNVLRLDPGSKLGREAKKKLSKG